MAATGPGRKPAETPGAPTPIPYQIAPRRDPTGDDGPVLVCEGLFRSFGGVQALRGVDLRLDAGRLHGLIGPNGSGKSTLLRCLSGTLRCDCGRMLHRDVDITALDEVARARAGIVRTFARTAVLAGLTAADHAAIGLQRRWPESGWMRAVLKTPRYRDEAERRQAAATRLLAVVGLDELAGRDPLTLSAGRQRLLQLAAT